MDQRVGNYSFIIGVIIAVVLGLVSLGAATPWLASLLVVLGLIVGFLNVTGKETKEFLIVATVLVIAASMGGAGTIISCKPFDKIVRLTNGQGKIVCSFNINGPNAFTTPLQISLFYTYMDSVQKKIKVIGTPR